MEASPSRSDSFSRGGLMGCSRARSFDADAGVGESFNSSTASFIDMDPEELFSMRWTAEEAGGVGFGPPCAGDGDDYSRLLANGPCEAGGIAGSAYASPGCCSSPALFHSALSTPASAVGSDKPRAPPLLATRRLLLRYLRFLVPLCRKARALRLPARAFSVPRSRSLAGATPARRSTSSATGAAEHWCHGNADTAVRDAILHCKMSLTPRAEC